MNKKAEQEITSLDQQISEVVARSRRLVSLVDVELDLLEDLQQIAVALHYSMQTLKHRLGIPGASPTGVIEVESLSDRRMELPLDTLPAETEAKEPTRENSPRTG